VLAVLRNPKLETAMKLSEADQRLRLQQQQAQVTWLTETRGAEAGLTNDLEQTKFELESARQQSLLFRKQAEGLTLRAPRAGMIQGLPTRDTLGKWLERGAELCKVGDPGSLRAVLLLEPSEHQRVQLGSPARIHPHGGEAHSVLGVVSEVSRLDARSIPPQLSAHAGGDVMTQQDPGSGQEKPQEPCYLVAVRLCEQNHRLQPGAMGRVRIEAESKTLAWRLRRWLALTFNYGL
jgi:multidrug resistance efflux pump